MSRYASLAAATEHLEPPYAVVDLEALGSNARAMAERAGGTPIRLASKSVRCRAIQRQVLAMDGYRGDATTLAQPRLRGSDIAFFVATITLALTTIGADRVLGR